MGRSLPAHVADLSLPAPKKKATPGEAAAEEKVVSPATGRADGTACLPDGVSPVSWVQQFDKESQLQIVEDIDPETGELTLEMYLDGNTLIARQTGGATQKERKELKRRLCMEAVTIFSPKAASKYRCSGHTGSLSSSSDPLLPPQPQPQP